MAIEICGNEDREKDATEADSYAFAGMRRTSMERLDKALLVLGGRRAR